MTQSYGADIRSPLEILNVDTSIESYDSTLRCRSFWDTLYVPLFPLIRVYVYGSELKLTSCGLERDPETMTTMA